MSSLELVVRGGDVIDGTGANRRRADVGVAQGRIVEIGEIAQSAAIEIDASGQIVSPGFIDVHTHLDVQGFWDPTLSPSPLHGVTTVFGGNCGFSVAPMNTESADYLMRMLSRVEGMPLPSLQQGVPWDWTSTEEFLSRLDNKLSINAGFMVGHSALRRVVMGEDATRRHATDAEIAAMAGLLRDGLRAGGLGFSSSWGSAHRDGAGAPVPSNHSSAEELVALASVCAEFEGTSLEFIPPNGRVPLEESVMELMADMSAAARRSLNWNLLVPGIASVDTCLHNLGASDLARERGGHVVALVIPYFSSVRLTFHSGILLDQLFGWADAMALPVDEKLRLLRDPQRRRQLELLAQEPSTERDFIASDWGKHVIFDTHSPETARYLGRSVREIAKEEGKSAFDALVDIVCADELRTGFGIPAPVLTGDDVARYQTVWKDSRAVIGGSDAGAHIDMVGTFNLSTAFLEGAVRRHGVMSLEEAVQRLTMVPAALYGLRDRGQLQVGAHADLVVFDEATIGSRPTTTRFDLPGDAGRLYAGAAGISHVFVNGIEIARDGEFTDARPGKIIRSGIDTATAFPN